jgi:hypothetical protein
MAGTIIDVLRMMFKRIPSTKDEFLEFNKKHNMKVLQKPDYFAMKPYDYLEFMQNILCLFEDFMKPAAAKRNSILANIDISNVQNYVTEMTTIRSFFSEMEQYRRIRYRTAVEQTLEHRLARTVPGLTSQNIDPVAVRKKALGNQKPVVLHMEHKMSKNRKKELGDRLMHIPKVLEDFHEFFSEDELKAFKERLQRHKEILQSPDIPVDFLFHLFEDNCKDLRQVISYVTNQATKELFLEYTRDVRYEMWLQLIYQNKNSFSEIRQMMAMLAPVNPAEITRDIHIMTLFEQACVLWLDRKERHIAGLDDHEMDRALQISAVDEEAILRPDPNQGRATRQPAAATPPAASGRRRRTRLTGGGLRGVQPDTGELDFRPQAAQPAVASEPVVAAEPDIPALVSDFSQLNLRYLNRRIVPLAENRLRTNEHWWWGVLFDYPDGRRVVWFDRYGSEITNQEEAISNPSELQGHDTFTPIHLNALQMDQFGNWGVRFQDPDGQTYTAWYDQAGVMLVD